MNFRVVFSCGLLKKFLTVALPLFYLATLATAQKQTEVWPLGKIAGITFKNGEPEKTSGTFSGNVSMAMSDANGNLLFYSDGETVWSRNHQQMPNGFGLKGARYQANCVIVQKPGDPNRFYIFSTQPNNWGAPVQSAHYSEVDLCLNNGFGDVRSATKNTPLFSLPANRIAVTQHANGIDSWVTFHKWQSDEFYCYRLTPNGLVTTPVISKTGYNLNFSSNSTGDGGEMKFSPDGKKLAMVVQQYACAEVYDFNNQTGIFTHSLHIPEMYRQNYYTPDYTFGIEFSPDASKLYLTRTNGCLLLQYDLAAGSKSAILKSRVILAGDTLQHNQYDYYVAYGLQMASNGKVYVSWVGPTTTGISAIENPNAGGVACNYQHDKIHWNNADLNPNYYFHSFPPFSSSYFNDQPSIQNSFDCISPRVQFSLDYAYTKHSEDIKTIVWNFDDPSSGTNALSSEVSPYHTFVGVGPHTVTVSVTWKDGSTSEVKQVLNIPAEVMQGPSFKKLGSDTTLCAGATLRLEAGREVVWQDGLTRSYYDVVKEGVYSYSVCRSGCRVADSIVVSYEHGMDLLATDTTLCPRANLRLEASALGTPITWQDGSVKNYFDVTTPGNYKYTTSRSGCDLSESILVDYEEEIDLLGNDTTLCEMIDRLSFDVTEFGEVVSWQDNTVAHQYTITEPGTYWVTVRTATCTITDSIAVSYCEPIVIPNVITPNGDDLNDKFEITGIKNERSSLTIFNRHGKVVYQKENYQNEWTGHEQSEGVYYYSLSVRTREIHGWIHLLR